MAIEMRGDLRNILLAYPSGAKRRVGFGITGGEYLLTDVVPYDDEFLKHQLEGNLEVVRFLGCDISENFPELALDPEAERSVAAFLEKHPKPVIGIHPGASRKNRLWDVGNWARLVDRIIENLHATVIVLHGPSDEECALAGKIRGLVSSNHRCVPYCETISHLISMIHHLDLLVALDSFSSHIAPSVGTPFVTLFGPQNPQLTRPYHFNGSIAVVEEMPCRPCGARCIYGDNNRCMKELSLDKVWHLVIKVWQRQGPKYPFFGLAIGENSPVKEIKP
jgi:heptosyltransferase II